MLQQLNITQLKNKDLAKRVKELRKRNGMSQELLAENSGLSLRTVQRIEN
ncbi:MAG: transcriptional regulator with XRE-family HTH domain, partial [Psychroserpens sp.]